MPKHKNSNTQAQQSKPEAPVTEQQGVPVMEPVAPEVQAELARLAGLSAAAGAAGMAPESPVANGKKTVKTPRERFVTIAPARVNKAAVALRNLIRCFGTGYESSDDEKGRIMDYLEPLIDDLRAAAAGTKEKRGGGFSL